MIGGPDAATAAKAVDELGKSMTAEQVAEAKKRATTWLAANWPDSPLW